MLALRRLLGLYRRSAPKEPPGDVSDPENPDNWLSLDYVHERVLVQLDAQSDIWDDADERLRLILGVIGIVFAAALGLQRTVSPTTAPLPALVGTAAIAAILIFLIAGAIVAVAYWPTPFDRPPKPSSLRDLYLTTDERETKLIVIDSIIAAYNHNEVVLARKIGAFKLAFVRTAAATGLLGLAVILEIGRQTQAW